MGLFNYQANANIFAEKLKNVNIDIFKSATTTVNLDGFLAEAEAFGDAVGPAGVTEREEIVTVRNFLLDDYDALQQVIVADGIQPNPNGQTVPVFDPAQSRSDATADAPHNPTVRFDLNEPANNDGTNGVLGELFQQRPDPVGDPTNGDTDIAVEEGGVAQRTLVVENVLLEDGSVSAGNSNILIDGQSAVDPGNGLIILNADQLTLSNHFVKYDADTNGNGIFGETDAEAVGGVGDAFNILVDCPEPGMIDFTNIENALFLRGAQFGGLEQIGGVSTTLRIEIVLEDADGDVAALRAYTDDTFNDNPNQQADLIIPLGLLNGDIPANIAAGDLINPGVLGFFSLGTEADGVQDPNPNIDFDRLVSAEFRLYGDPNQGTGPDAPPSDVPVVVGVENPTPDAFDVSFDLVEIVTVCREEIVRPGGGALAETLTAAQAIAEFNPSFPGLGFVEAFSESTAASDRGDVDMFV